MANHKGNLKWLQLLAAANSGRVEQVPKGFKPLEELAAELGIVHSTLKGKAPELIKADLLEKQLFVTMINNIVKQRPYYRLKK